MPTLVDKYFSKIDFDAIEASVKKAEHATTGEIVVNLASHSRNWMLERLLWSLGFGIVCGLVALYLTRESGWGVYYNTTQTLLWGAIGFVAAFFGIGAFLRREQRRRRVVWNRALGLFGRLTPTRQSTGVFILMSLDENEAAIVADKGIAAKVPSNYWLRPHDVIVSAMKKGNHAEGLIEAIEMIAVELAREFPSDGTDPDELPDRPTEIK